MHACAAALGSLNVTRNIAKTFNLRGLLRLYDVGFFQVCGLEIALGDVAIILCYSGLCIDNLIS
jgi:hypothetical protein